jgi:hypothetical protein
MKVKTYIKFEEEAQEKSWFQVWWGAGTSLTFISLGLYFGAGSVMTDINLALLLLAMASLALAFHAQTNEKAKAAKAYEQYLDNCDTPSLLNAYQLANMDKGTKAKVRQYLTAHGNGVLLN